MSKGLKTVFKTFKVNGWGEKLDLGADFNEKQISTFDIVGGNRYMTFFMGKHKNEI